MSAGTASPHRSRSVRVVYFSLGVVSLAVGFIGVALPLIPTTGPILLAAFFFARSSERVHGWLLSHRVLGPVIRDYQAGLGIPLKAKVTAVVMIALTFGVTMALVVNDWAWRALLVATAIGIVWFILSRPTKREASSLVEA